VTEKPKKKAKKNQKANKKTFHIAQEAGDLPVLRRKVALTPDQIDTNDIEETD